MEDEGRGENLGEKGVVAAVTRRGTLENDRRLDVSNLFFFSIVLQKLRGGHRSPHQDSCLENPHGQQSLAGYTPRGHKESDTTERLSTAQHIYMYG